MTKILELHPSFDKARRNIIRLKPMADEKREKMKEEIIGKLKEMGNSILGRFGQLQSSQGSKHWFIFSIDAALCVLSLYVSCKQK
ncbi:hypothetical protein Leryth_017087 [Lithospermum erythrorhizon]|uniref:Uncharacterized protein n=1 Tax=Lithospermum erythrorhizon TaxID=34254 RepID=A0AAV3PIY0_LITER|nr:hypothetical protein Leryth_017087 [Lithospermum erythrorhizon]